MKVYQHIAAELQRAQSKDATHSQWARNCIRHLEENYLPNGSGFDNGCEILTEYSPNKFLLSCDFHHLNDNGFYTGWSRHKAIVKPDLMYGFNARITGRNVNDIKDYIADVIYSALDSDILPAEWQELMKDCKP